MRVSDVQGGTWTVGVPADVFAMPDGRRMRYDAPSPALGDGIMAYAVYCNTDGAEEVDWFLPAPAMISVVVDAGPLSVSVGNHRFGPVARASLYGPTSRAFRTTTTGGIMVGVGVSAVGWARLSRRRASDFHNRVVPLAGLLGAGLAERLVARLDAAPDDAAVKAVLDATLAPVLAVPHPDEPLIRAFTALTVEPGVIDIADVCDRIGVPSHALRRMAQRYFGMTPKLLLRRARFLRSLLPLLHSGDVQNYRLIDPSYYDVSHFLRDSHAFLGGTPRRFMQQGSAFLRASLGARAAVLGAGTQALHRDPVRMSPTRPPVHAAISSHAPPG